MKDKEDASIDALDAKILTHLIEDVRQSYNVVGEKIGVDERTVARRVQRMKDSAILRTTVDIDWLRLGFGAMAYVGCRTSMGHEQRTRLYKLVEEQPHILESFSTVGSNEYVLKILSKDVHSLREEVLAPLEPLTTDLNTSIISSQVKRPNYSVFLTQQEDGASRR
jgi:Lrp/AsnC family leucine-responsive transcriptional regulator